MNAIESGVESGVAARHSSESAEHYTPSAIVEAARTTLGAIDLDPASCAAANAVVKASRFFDASDNGFERRWDAHNCDQSRVFLNPPGGKMDPTGRSLRKSSGKGAGYVYVDTGERCIEPAISSAKAWWFKLAAEYVNGFVSSAIFVAFSLELLQVAQVAAPAGLPTPLDFALCVPSRRVAYLKPDGTVGKSPPHASAVIYIGSERRLFAESFASIGRCKIGGAS